MILAAGLGTRLRPLTLELPKPLVPVGDASLLSLSVAGLRAAGIEDILVNAYHLPGRLQEEVERLGPGVQLSVEPRVLGTAGGLSFARGRLKIGRAHV